MESVLSIGGLAKSFSGQQILQDFGLEVKASEFITLLGPSGCGKTTLLRIIAGFENPDNGIILLDGKNLLSLPAEKRQVNTVFQSYALFPHLTVFHNVAFGLKIKKINGKELETRVNQALEQVKMTDFSSRYPHQLSGGQQQRVAMARAIVNRPRILLLDEPLSALDARLRREMQLELKKLQRELGISFIFVTHDQEEALSMSDRILVMQDGRIAQLGTPRQVYEEPENLYVAKFIGDSNFFPGEISTACDPDQVEVTIFGQQITAHTRRKFQPGDKVVLLLRPEDLRLYETPPKDIQTFAGSIVERSYRGSTLDTLVRLDDGPLLTACEFFDEDDPDFDYSVDERVYVAWVKGWEVVLPDENY
ncbi:spermidine/putrescine ABC transporter ATP-binding protein PotA [uncultured Desulfobacter sp.]|uniref:spermidine/putrescine ABC transporter ATP-binding protein PotA n=1 Tax=uncultured Desulfobacter sp. TaxID=240139 RepID=UPI002AAADC6E|nr:spermidine/putrescine ABC transporter ATP-binding protein PotA [uncultured Desulfobacter sp.]